MNKRMFIDTVRQFKSLAARKHKSYADSVRELERLYLQSCADSGASDAELAKEVEWAAAFVAREYAPVDAQFNIPDAG